MRDEIEELILHMADLKEAIAKAKHPWPLKREYARHKAHLKKLFGLQKMARDIKYANMSTFAVDHGQRHEQRNPQQTVGLEPVGDSLADDLGDVSGPTPGSFRYPPLPVDLVDSRTEE